VRSTACPDFSGNNETAVALPAPILHRGKFQDFWRLMGIAPGGLGGDWGGTSLRSVFRVRFVAPEVF